MDQQGMWLGRACLACLLALCLSGCEDEAAPVCETDLDCDPGFVCREGVCRQRELEEPDAGSDPGGDPGSDPGGDPAGDPGSDPGGDPAGDPGSDPGTDQGDDSPPLWTITPGVGVGPVTVSASQASPTTLGQVRAALGEAGGPVGSANFTLAFRGDTMWVAGIDVNDNQTFDDADHVISVTVLEGLNAQTDEGLRLGSTLGQVRAVPRFSNPDRSVDLPPYGEYPGGKMEEYFTTGIFFGYDDTDTCSIIIVTRTYPQPPDATIHPTTASLTFGSTTIECGMGYDGDGSERDDHLGVLGEPDYQYTFETEVDTQIGPQDVQMYLDSYRILGMEFIGGDDEIFIYRIDRLILVALYPFFYGRTPAGNGLGSTKGSWEAELTPPAPQVVDNPEYDGRLYVYLHDSDHKFGIVYTNDGASPDDVATFLVLNYQEAP